eukprot:snap_masked-scaffold_4-processed-gene-0.30-mRNA-1 protein AED:1.00 eAED:1.00 QI:0/-1/0/0/-1/1/1/0/327
MNASKNYIITFHRSRKYIRLLQEIEGFNFWVRLEQGIKQIDEEDEIDILELTHFKFKLSEKEKNLVLDFLNKIDFKHLIIREMNLKVLRINSFLLSLLQKVGELVELEIIGRCSDHQLNLIYILLYQIKTLKILKFNSHTNEKVSKKIRKQIINSLHMVEELHIPFSSISHHFYKTITSTINYLKLKSLGINMNYADEDFLVENYVKLCKICSKAKILKVSVYVNDLNQLPLFLASQLLLKCPNFIWFIELGVMYGNIERAKEFLSASVMIQDECNVFSKIFFSCSKDFPQFYNNIFSRSRTFFSEEWSESKDANRKGYLNSTTITK